MPPGAEQQAKRRAEGKEKEDAEEKKDETPINNVAALAQRRIQELDKQVKHMQQNRRLCQNRIDADREELVHIEREQASIRHRYDPLCQRYEAHVEERDQVAARIADVTQQLNAFMSMTTGRCRLANMADARHRKANALTELRAERGFSAAAGSTFVRRKRPGTSASSAVSRGSSRPMTVSSRR